MHVLVAGGAALTAPGCNWSVAVALGRWGRRRKAPETKCKSHFPPRHFTQPLVIHPGDAESWAPVTNVGLICIYIFEAGMVLDP